MLAITATTSSTSGIQPSSPRRSSSTLIAEISSITRRIETDTAAPWRTAAAAPVGTYTVLV